MGGVVYMPFLGKLKMKCDYCGQVGIEVDCTGNTCCAECWEGMKDWTLEKQAELEKMSEEVCAWFDKERPIILAENGLPPDAKGIVCTQCRKMVKCDEEGYLSCDCRDERKGIDPNDPSVVPIPERFMRGM
jgi:hypothetical protein